MPYKEGTLMQQVQPLVSARKNAVSGITAVLGVTLFVEEVQRIRVLPFSLVHYEYLALLAVIGALVFLWIWGSEELEMLGRWLDPQEFPVPSSFNPWSRPKRPKTRTAACSCSPACALPRTAGSPGR